MSRGRPPYLSCTYHEHWNPVFGTYNPTTCSGNRLKDDECDKEHGDGIIDII
jgi:hypothetical protein